MNVRTQCLTVLMLTTTMIASPAAARASQQEEASRDAIKVVLKQEGRPSETQIVKMGPEYAKLFWQEYRSARQRWETAYQQGLKHDHQEIDPNDKVALNGFQAGYHDSLRGVDRLLSRQDDKNPGNLEERPSTKVSPPLQSEKKSLTKQPAEFDFQQPLKPWSNFPNNSRISSPVVGSDQQSKKQANFPTDDPPTTPVHPTASGRAFIKQIAPLAKQVGHDYDLYPSVMLAQAALESNWGRSELTQKHHNLFGVKAIAGSPSVVMPTQEADEAGHLHQVQAAFRRYHNVKEALFDYGNTLSDPLYNGAHRKQARTYQEATRALDGKYATDPHYSQKLDAIIAGSHLDQYDHEVKAAHHRPPHFHWGQSLKTRSKKKHSEAQQRRSQGQNHWAALGILGGAGSVSLWGFFKSLLGA